jgi:DNA-binding transcriptional LysR family regulator
LGLTGHLKTLEGSSAGARSCGSFARGVSPTPHGHALAALAREAAPHLDALAALSEVLSAARGLQRTTYVGGPADLLATKALPALVPLIAHLPRLRGRARRPRLSRDRRHAQAQGTKWGLA